MIRTPRIYLTMVMLPVFLAFLSCPVHAQAIIDAVKRQDLATVQRLLREDPRAVAATDIGGSTPLHWAARLGNLQIMQLLLMYRAGVDVRQHEGDTPLHSAAATNQAEAIQLLIDHGADPNTRSGDGNAPLHKAAAFDQTEAVNFLLSNGVDIDTPNAEGNTALAVAAWYDRVGTGQFLIACGANLRIKNKSGKTALDEANGNRHAGFARMLMDYQQALDERAARDLVRKASGLNLRTTYGAWTDRGAVTKTVYREDFHGNMPGAEWKLTPAGALQIATTPIGNRRFLGEFGNHAVVLTLADLPEHREIAITFDLFILRSMDGNIPGVGPDIWSLGVIDGPTLIQTTFANQRSNVRPMLKCQAYPGEYPGDHNSPCEGAAETNTLGYKFKNDDASSMDSVYRIRYTFANSGRAIQFRFAGTNLQDPDARGPDESWGITNVQVAVAVAPAIPAATAHTVHPAPGSRPAAHPAIPVRRAAPKPIKRAVVHRSKPAFKPKPAPTVNRIHSKKVAPKP